jgi:hypothetical protein
MSDIQAINEALFACGYDFCEYLFPDGKTRYGKFYVGNIQGDAGDSLVVTLTGSREGCWKDFATGEGSNNLFDLLYAARENNFTKNVREAENWLKGRLHGALEAPKGQPRVKSGKSTKVDCGDLVRFFVFAARF